MSSFKKGDTVKLKAVVPAGPVVAMRMDEDGNVQCLVEWTDTNGNTTQRWFDQDQLEASGQ
jgi:uncharacterized protein YodC (DUF2158 family)